MKKCYKSIKSNFLKTAWFWALMISVSFVAQLYATPVGVITRLQGRAFVIHNGQTSVLKVGMMVEDFSEILSEEGSVLTFNDYFDHRYHVAGSGQLRVMRRLIDLKRGYLWVQTLQKAQAGQVQTPNARADHNGAEFIISFNPATGKTQILTLEGVVQFVNLWEEDFASQVKEGTFSFIDKNYENGNPRMPTQIGFDSFKKITGLYPNVSPMKGSSYLFPLEQKGPSRSLASVKTAPVVSGKVVSGKVVPGKSKKLVVQKQKKARRPATSNAEGKFHYRKLPEKIKVTKFDMNSYHKSKLESVKKSVPLKKWKPNYDKPSGLKINIFDSQAKSPKESQSSRAPASLMSPSERVIALEINPQDSGFDHRLTEEYKRQMRHTNQVNRLIEDLKNYENNYQIAH